MGKTLMRRGLVAGTLLVAMLAALPMQTAMAEKPHREQEPGAEFSFIVPDNESPCPFAILVEADSSVGLGWEFSDGHLASTNVLSATFTNLETGTTYVHRSDYHSLLTLAADGTEHVVINGMFWAGFLEGDQGPEGEVGPGGAAYFLDGRQSYVYNPSTDAVTSFEFVGRAVDSCEVLA